MNSAEAKQAYREASDDFETAAAAMAGALQAGGDDAADLRAKAADDYFAATARRDRAHADLLDAERAESAGRKRKRASVLERAGEMICPECGNEVERKSKHGPTPVFCSTPCRTAFNNRALTDGAGVIAYLKAWRADRGSGEIAQISFARICTIVDSLNDQDRMAERPRADLYAAKVIARNLQTVEELRYGRRKRAETKAREARAATPEEGE